MTPSLVPELVARDNCAMTRAGSTCLIVAGIAMMAISGGTYLVVMGHFNSQPPAPRWIEVFGRNIFCCVAVYPLGLILFGIGIYVRTRLQFLTPANVEPPTDERIDVPSESGQDEKSSDFRT
jgi:hypothetical protein